MRIKIVKEHDHYPLGSHEVENDRGNYLISMGVAQKDNQNPDEEIEKGEEKIPFVEKKIKIAERKIEVKKRGRKLK